MDRRWTLAIVTLITVLMVYTFLSMVLKKDKKRTVHTRMYRDYSDYGKKDENDYDFDTSNTYASSAEARKIRKSIFKNLDYNTSVSYNSYMAAATSHMPDPSLPKSNKNPQFEEMERLANKPLPELQSGLSSYQNGNYEEALDKFKEAISKLDPMELKRRIQLHSLIAECCIKLRDDEGYIQNKIKQVRLNKKYKKLISEAYPELRESESFSSMDFMTTQEASKNLLQVKSAVARLPSSPMVDEMLKKAELNLEVARKISQ